MNSAGYNYFELDSEDYSIFPYEKEILLRDGLKFNIKSIKVEYDEETDKEFYLV